MAPDQDLLLSDSELAAIQAKYPKPVRQQMEARWSFSGIVSSIAHSKHPAANAISTVLHGYSTASHLQHADYQGVMVPMERERRPEPRRTAIHFAHASRLVSDVVHYAHLRLLIAYRFIGKSQQELEALQATIAPLSAELENAYAHWMSVEYSENQ